MRRSLKPPRWVWLTASLVARAAGPALSALLAARSARPPEGDVAHASMWEDLYFKRETEISFLNSELARRGEQLGVPTPVNQALARAVQTAEATGLPYVKPADLGRHLGLEL